MNSKPGTYALVLRSDASTWTRIGRWGRVPVNPVVFQLIETDSQGIGTKDFFVLKTGELK